MILHRNQQLIAITDRDQTSCSPHAVFVISQAAAATFETQNTIVPRLSGVAIGLLIAISLSFDRT